MSTQAAIVLSAFAAVCPCALALNPSLDIHQYAHKAWTVRDGFFESGIQTIAQTPDGYLWLGTELGLLRFDGVRTVPWQPPAGERLPSSDIRTLLVTRDGSLWIGTRDGLATWKGARLIHYPELAGQIIGALVEDDGGTVWVGGAAAPTGRLCAIRTGGVQCFGEDGSFGRGVDSLFEENGNLWADSVTGLWRWKPGPPKRYVLPSNREVTGFSKTESGSLLIAQGGLLQLAGDKAEPYPIGNTAQSVRLERLLMDRNGGLWIGTLQHGLLRLHQGRTDRLTRPEGLSGNWVEAFFEDREGNIWVGTGDGLDRFRDLAVPTIPANPGLSSDVVVSVLATQDGSVWLGTVTGLNRWTDGQITAYGEHAGFPKGGMYALFGDDRGRIWLSTKEGVGPFEDGKFLRFSSTSTINNIENIAGDRPGSLWLMDLEQGLIHLLGEEVTERIPWVALGHKDFALSMASDPARGGLWLGFRNGGVGFFKDGQIRESYTTAQGLGGGMVRSFYIQSDGSVWAATAGGASRIKDHRVTTLNARNGLPCDTAHWMIEDDQHSVWLYMACGLVRMSRAELDAWLANPNRTVRGTVFDSSDGVTIQDPARGYSPLIARATDGRLWFGNMSGVSVIDPRDLHFNNRPPPVHIEGVIADHKTYDASSNQRLPALTRDLEIDYTALSLVAPEKNRFKYKLEGYDRDWQDVGNRRQAFYDNLSPRSYRFRVIASNNSGVWNEAGDSLDFSIAPAYYQTNWFRASLVAAFFLALWVIYRMRLRQIAREFNANLEGRVDERLRVARDLHDTLLQSFQGLMPVFQTARNLLPGQSDRAAEVLDEGLHDAAEAIVEGRSAIQNLRAKPSLDPDLGSLLNAAGQELAQSPEAGGSAPALRVVVEGSRLPLVPLLRDEIYRIGREVLRNAFRHAHAGRIEVEIRYERDMFRLRIRDDGKGIDSSVLKEGVRPGHFGLPGMHERAKSMGGRLKVWSEPGAGTEAELTVPARIAYEKFSTSNGWWARLGRRLRLTAPDREAS